MPATVLVVDDEENARTNIIEYLTPMGYEAVGASTLAEAREKLEHGIGDVVLLDVSLPDGYGPSLLEENKGNPNRPPMIIFTAHGDIDMAVESMKNGAHDFMTKPIQLDQMESSIRRALEVVKMRRELAHYRQAERKNLKFVVGQSEKFKKVLDYCQRASQAQVSVLITGENGVGKEVIAKYIHQSGPRASKTFVAINCAAMQTTLLESELFGYEPGAYTGADKRKLGLMELADGGILFLDEISSMPFEMQAKLLRAIEEKSFRRVGGTTEIKVDPQILAASNRNLKELIEKEKFREDLYYRLKVMDVHIPPLRERKEDIPELVGFLVRNLNPRLGSNVETISQAALEAIKRYDWPGNIRELDHALQHAMLMCDGQTIEFQDLPLDVQNPT